VEALARKVIDVHALTDRPLGVTTNVGLVSGGRSVNTVAPTASGEIDFRFAADEDGERVAASIRAILERPEAVNPSSGHDVTGHVEPGGGLLWPTLTPTPESRRLSALVSDAVAEVGLRGEGIARGGASDAAHAAAAGVPAICGLGPVTSGIHTDSEHTSVAAVGTAVRVAARVISRLA
jgi:glutamate carboxypeptidase